MDVIKFTNNWNGKLNPNVRFFTTIRKIKPTYYIEGRAYEVYLNDKFLFVAEIKLSNTLKFGDLHPITVMLDTGYCYDEACKIFMNFLKCPTIDNLKIQYVDHLLFHRSKN